MSLADLIASRSSSASLEEPVTAVEGTEDGPSATADESAGSSSEEPGPSLDHGDWANLPTNEPEEKEPVEDTVKDEAYGVKEVETPSGICIYYQAGPKRLYRLRGKATTPSGVAYTDWKQVPSVSEILDILEKGGLPWWGMKVGVAGVQQMVRDEAITAIHLLDNDPEYIVDLLKKHKLTVNHVRDQAGDRGTNVHDALELWAEKGIAPQVEVYAPEEQGYVAALAQFLIDSGAEAKASEVMVGSLKHRFAGRYDLEAELPKNAEVFVHRTEKGRGDRAEKLAEGGLYLLDLKTSKSVYDTHFLQMEAYEAARVECGYEPTVDRGVIHVMPDGRYKLDLNAGRVKFTDFKHVLGAKKALDRIKGRK